MEVNTGSTNVRIKLTKKIKNWTFFKILKNPNQNVVELSKKISLNLMTIKNFKFSFSAQEVFFDFEEKAEYLSLGWLFYSNNFRLSNNWVFLVFFYTTYWKKLMSVAQM